MKGAGCSALDAIHTKYLVQVLQGAVRGRVKKLHAQGDGNLHSTRVPGHRRHDTSSFSGFVRCKQAPRRPPQSRQAAAGVT